MDLKQLVVLNKQDGVQVMKLKKKQHTMHPKYRVTKHVTLTEILSRQKHLVVLDKQEYEITGIIFKFFTV